MNGSAGKPHANGNGPAKDTENHKSVANGNGVHSTVEDEQQSTLAPVEDAALLPHLESIERLMKLPVVEATWHQSQDVYGKVKGKQHWS